MNTLPLLLLWNLAAKTTWLLSAGRYFFPLQAIFLVSASYTFSLTLMPINVFLTFSAICLHTCVFELPLNYVVLINVHEDPSCVEIHFNFFTLKVFNLIYNYFLPLKTGHQQQASPIQIVVLFTKKHFHWLSFFFF